MKAATAAPAQEVTPHHAFVSEVFHNLSQPLTALHCSLELALNRDRTVEELRGSIQTALENAERLRQRLLLVRALADAAEAGDLSQPADLAELFRELREDMAPLCESAGVRLDVQNEARAILVRGNQARLAQAMFCLLEYLLRYAPPGATIAIRIRASEEQAEILISAAGALPVGPSLHGAEPYSCEIEMARRTFGAVGGEFKLEEYRPDSSVWRATLALSQT